MSNSWRNGDEHTKEFKKFYWGEDIPPKKKAKKKVHRKARAKLKRELKKELDKV